MRLPISWLKEFVPKLPPTPKLVETLMMHGLEVEEVIDDGAHVDHVVVGQIMAIKPHPNADKLRLANVLIDPKGEPVEIVCGAPNIEVGQKVPVALIGATLPNGLTIAKRAIRGIESNGMLCAVDELGLGHDHSGVMVLDVATKVGLPLAEALGLDDVVLDIAIPANRSDLMAVRGLAWEIAAMLGTPIKLPSLELSEGKTLTSQSIKLSIADAKKCSLLTARVIRGATLKPTPQLIVQRLKSAGMRSVNVVVDVTNYIMLEYGQPLHAYDADKLVGGELNARVAKNGESLQTLDGKTRTLSADMLVIADAKEAVDLAGVMGGASTEISSTTTNIVLEAAIFDPVTVRRTSRQLGLMSEASRRFEKGLWPSLPVQASAAAAAMIVDICGGEVEQGIVRAGTAKHTVRTIVMNPAYVTERLGLTVSATKSKSILTKLGFTVKGTAKKWTVTVPEWRLDVSLPEDLVDEIGRMVGYEKLPKEMPTNEVAEKDLPPMVRFKEELRNILVEMGFTEVVSHAFYSEGEGKAVQGAHVTVANPLDTTQHLLRKSLRPQLYDVLDKQADAGEDAKVFELGRIFDPNLSKAIEGQQPWKIAIGVCNKEKSSVDKYIPVLQSNLKTTVAPEGRTESTTSNRGRDISIMEFDIATLLKGAKVKFGPWDPKQHVAENVQLRQQSKYPAVTRDVAFWWPHDEAKINQTLSALGIDTLRDYTVKDTFVKDGRTSYALTFVYQSFDRTLTKAEVDKAEQKIKDALMKHGAEIR